MSASWRFASVFLATALAAGAGSTPISAQVPVAPLTQAQVESLVREDVARRLQVPLDAVSVTRTDARTWTDLSLGCGTGRRGLDDAALSISGFEVVVVAGGKQVVYHTDRTGGLVRCPPAAKKPLDRISD